MAILALMIGSFEVADAQISLPQLGFKVEGETIRPIWGIPGSSRTGKPLDLSALVRVEIASDQQYLLGVRSADHQLMVVDLGNTASPVATPIEGSFGDPDGLAVSPTGSAAAIFSSRDRAVQIISGLPNHPAIRESYPVKSEHTPNAMAVSDDGKTVLFAADGYLWTAGKDGNSRFGSARGRISAIQFLRNSQDAVVADQGFNELLLIKADEPGNQKSLLYSSRDGISRPVGIGLSKDGTRLFIANASNGTVAIGDLANGRLTVVPCGCEIAGWYSLAVDSSFRISDPKGASYIIDAHTSVPQVSFILPQVGD